MRPPKTCILQGQRGMAVDGGARVAQAGGGDVTPRLKANIRVTNTIVWTLVFYSCSRRYPHRTKDQNWFFL